MLTAAGWAKHFQYIVVRTRPEDYSYNVTAVLKNLL